MAAEGGTMTLPSLVTELYSGRITRSRYWLLLPLAMFVGLFACTAFVALPLHLIRVAFADDDPLAGVLLTILFGLVALAIVALVSIPVVWRLHDLGQRGLLALAPFGAMALGMVLVRTSRLLGSVALTAVALLILATGIAFLAYLGIRNRSIA
jgi:uncharacterized membrane protein YhaH (DUF805 family)